MPKLRTLAPRLRLAPAPVRLPPKVKASVYDTPEFHAWRAYVVARAGYRCEWVDHGHQRCTKAWPEHRMYGDHIIELSDGGKAFDLSNGQCLCASHHELKTLAARTRRLHGQK